MGKKNQKTRELGFAIKKNPKQAAKSTTKPILRCVFPGMGSTPTFCLDDIDGFSPVLDKLLASTAFKPLLSQVHVLDVHNVLDVFPETSKETPFHALSGVRVAVSWVGNVNGGLANSMVPELRMRMKNGQIHAGIICSIRGQKPKQKKEKTKEKTREMCELDRKPCLEPGSKAFIIAAVVKTVSKYALLSKNAAVLNCVDRWSKLVPATFFDDAEDHVESARALHLPTLHCYLIDRVAEHQARNYFESVVVRALAMLGRQRLENMYGDAASAAPADPAASAASAAGDVMLPFPAVQCAYEHCSTARLLTTSVPELYRPLLHACVDAAKPSAAYHDIVVGGRSVTQNRKTVFFGPEDVVGYAYSGQVAEATPMPLLLQQLTRLVNRQFGTAFNGILFNWYEAGPKTGIGFHSDASPTLDAPLEKVVALSMGGSRTFRLKDKTTRETVFDHATQEYEVMCMDGPDFQKLLLHGIPYRDNAPERFSFTFRKHPKTEQDGEGASDPID